MSIEHQHKRRSSYPWFVALTFILLAVSFQMDLWKSTHPKEVVNNPLVDESKITKSTVRNTLTGPVIRQAGFTYDCNECHQHFDPSERKGPLIAAHRDIMMEHGINQDCLICHAPHKRKFLLDINGEPNIPLLKSELLCQRCHGAKYKDWMNGNHGRQSEFWNEKFGEPKKVTCVACHNPHSPKFKPMEPLPGPSRKNFTTDKEEHTHHE